MVEMQVCGRPKGQEVFGERLLSKTSMGVGYIGNCDWGNVHLMDGKGFANLHHQSFGLSLPATGRVDRTWSEVRRSVRGFQPLRSCITFWLAM